MMRLLLHIAVALLPWWLKNPLYRWFCGYHIARSARIGLSPILVERSWIGEHTRIGHFNFFWRTKELLIEDHVRIGHFNLFRGGRLIHIERYAEILRANVVNSIPEPDAENELVPEFRLGAGSIVTTAHWIDFTDAVSIGCRSIIGGRHSSIWTHSRQWTRPITIGSYAYLGSEVRLAPGAQIPPRSVVGLGSVIIDPIKTGQSLIAGNPAKPVKKLDAHGLRLLERKTRRDLPDDVGVQELELQEVGPHRNGLSEAGNPERNGCET